MQVNPALYFVLDDLSISDFWPVILLLAVGLFASLKDA